MRHCMTGSYVAHFQRNLADLFLSTFQVADDGMQRSMMHLFDTWRNVFAQSVLANIERALPPRPQKAGRVATRCCLLPKCLLIVHLYTTVAAVALHSFPDCLLVASLG